MVLSALGMRPLSAVEMVKTNGVRLHLHASLAPTFYALHPGEVQSLNTRCTPLGFNQEAYVLTCGPVHPVGRLVSSWPAALWTIFALVLGSLHGVLLRLQQPVSTVGDWHIEYSFGCRTL